MLYDSIYIKDKANQYTGQMTEQGFRVGSDRKSGRTGLKGSFLGAANIYFNNNF